MQSVNRYTSRGSDHLLQCDALYAQHDSNQKTKRRGVANRLLKISLTQALDVWRRPSPQSVTRRNLTCRVSSIDWQLFLYTNNTCASKVRADPRWLYALAPQHTIESARAYVRRKILKRLSIATVAKDIGVNSVDMKGSYPCSIPTTFDKGPI